MTNHVMNKPSDTRLLGSLGNQNKAQIFHDAKRTLTHYVLSNNKTMDAGAWELYNLSIGYRIQNKVRLIVLKYHY
jgi:hypothetical protein